MSAPTHDQMLAVLLAALRNRQSWCPCCGGAYVCELECILRAVWFPTDGSEP